MSFQDIEAGRPFGSRRGLMNGKQDPTQAVAAGIFQINTAVSTFQRLVNTLGTPKDTPDLREKLHKTRLHIGQLVKDTSAKLKQASDIDHHAEVNASKKIADAKLAKDFQAVLKEFQKAQRLAAERETAYTPFVPQAVLPSSYTASEVDVGSDKSPEQRALLVESRRWESLSWSRIVGPLAAKPASHFAQFCDGFGGGKNHKTWCRWWIALTSSIWQHRNLLVFQGHRFDPAKVMEDALLLTWSWVKTRDKKFCTSFNHWSSNLGDYFAHEQPVLAMLPVPRLPLHCNLISDFWDDSDKFRWQEVLFLDNEIAFNEAIIEEREQGIQEIQQQIGEVNEIFKDLAVLVHEQGAMIDDIGSNIENSHAATAQAKSQLAKASKTQRSNSSLIIALSAQEGREAVVDGIYMLAFGDFWDCASHRDHSSCCLVKDCLNSIMEQMHIYREADSISLADDVT
ncbi:Syntaxin-22 [Glycine soja]|uniref:Syntaxin-22 n=1 Tax=Glycine soja TaxID=3848 RepID=A0A445GFJ6_GLYSO|nr:Syntaxin-22 [Glycine soja]